MPAFSIRYFRSFNLQKITGMLVAGTLAFAATSSAQETKTSKEVIEAEVIDADPAGEPPHHKKPVNAVAYYVWRDGDVWHVRTKTKKDRHEFRGAIFVHGGKLTKIFNYGNLEAAAKKKKAKTKAPEDVGRWNKEQNRVDFKFSTAGGEDGFDFKVDNDVEKIAFDLRIDGDQRPGQIVIGKENKRPVDVPFALPASVTNQTK